MYFTSRKQIKKVEILLLRTEKVNFEKKSQRVVKLSFVEYRTNCRKVRYG